MKFAGGSHYHRQGCHVFPPREKLPSAVTFMLVAGAWWQVLTCGVHKHATL